MADFPTSADEQRVLADTPTRLLLGGDWVDSPGSKSLAVEDPSTGELIAEVADASAADMIRALDAADGARREWEATAPRDRGEILRRAFDAMIARRDDLALLMTMEMGRR